VTGKGKERALFRGSGLLKNPSATVDHSTMAGIDCSASTNELFSKSTIKQLDDKSRGMMLQELVKISDLLF
jgi:hypothetical protein